MKENPDNPYLAHQDILLTLPWYVNKTLRDSEMKAVENHLKVCLMCRREVVALQKLSLAVNSVDALESAAHASFSRLQKRIHQPDKPAVPPSPKITARAQHRKWYQKLGFDYFKRPQAVFAMISVLMLSMLAPGYYIIGKMQKNDFRTLSSGESPALKANELKVIFLEGTTQPQKSKILDSVHGQIVDGPTPEGVYLVRISQIPETGNILDTLSALRKSSNIIFAEPAYALLSSSQPGGAPR